MASTSSGRCSAAPPNITSFAPPSPVSDTEGATRTFNITVNQTVNVSWQINGMDVQTNESVIEAEASYTNTSAKVGTRNVSAIVTNDNGTAMQTWTWIVQTSEKLVFDTGAPANPYPSIMGNHTGTIKPNHTVIATKLYTYPCAGTGGHTEYARIWNLTWNATATWEGYAGDWHNITFNKTVVLLANETYNYTVRTGSYPQIHHTDALPTDNGWINCTGFIDANGKRYNNWVPAIRVW